MPDAVAKHRSGPKRSWYYSIPLVLEVMANLFVVLGVPIALLQIHDSEQSERRRIAIEAVSELRSPRFLEAYTRIIDAGQPPNQQNIVADPDLRDDLLYLVSAYKNIACLYRNNLADKRVILLEIDPGFKSIMVILQANNYPENIADLQEMLSDLKNLQGNN